MNNYRITFAHHLQIKKGKLLQAEAYDYFKDSLKYYPVVEKILEKAKEIGIKDIWFFYEPYIEITWLSDKDQSNELFHAAVQVCLDNNIDDWKMLTPENGDFGEWFCESEEEREFGAKRYSLCRQFVQLYNKYKEPVDKGKGLRKQVERTIHGLCNPLGLTYWEEAKLCFSRGLICLLFIFLPFEKAVYVYKNVFRQKY